MKLIILVLIFTGLFQVANAQTDGAKNDSGKLTVFKSGKTTGTETFSIKNGESSESSTSLDLGGRVLNFKTTTEYKGGLAKVFTLDQEPNIKLQFAINGNEVKVTGVQETTGKTDESALILENLVWHQYYFLIQHYDSKKGGAQQFKALIPSVLATIGVSLERKDVGVTFEGIPGKLDHYQAIFEPVTAVHIWTDSAGKIVDVAIPGQGLEVMREEYAAKIDSFHKGIEELQKNRPQVEIDYSVPADAPFTAEEVTVQAKGHTLAGTLLLPKKGKRPFPAVITITGSGQQTRDEPIELPGLEKYKPFRQIAEALASKGIAVLRVDDRAVGKSTGRDGIKEATTFDYADDTRAQVAFLRTRKEIDPNRIGLIGHSEGGVIAPLVASTDPKIAAIVLLAGTGKTGEKVIMDQTAFSLDGNPNTTKEHREAALQQQQVLLTAAMSGDMKVNVPDQLRLPWYVAFLKYDPIPTIRKVHQPILILQGEKDQQVTADQAPILQQAALSAGNKNVTMKVFPGLNHLFLPSKTGALSEYSHLEVTTLQPDVLDTITTWFQQKLKP